MNGFDEAAISTAIVNAYHEKLLRQIRSDVVIVGAGPAGLTAARYLALCGKKVTVIEKRLAPGGGVWGGGMGMNVIVIQAEAEPILRDAGVRCGKREENLWVVDAAELACALCLEAIRAGAVFLNLTAFEDICVRQGRVTGVVINRSTILGALPVDPITMDAQVVIDATGHDAVVVESLRKRHLTDDCLPKGIPGEGPMDARAGEAFVANRTSEIYPGLWIAGMSVCTTLGGPRMGPIFGGMLLSGKKAAEMILASGK
jgi:thiazole biosynthesis enzyme